MRPLFEKFEPKFGASVACTTKRRLRARQLATAAPALSPGYEATPATAAQVARRAVTKLSSHHDFLSGRAADDRVTDLTLRRVCGGTATGYGGGIDARLSAPGA